MISSTGNSIGKSRSTSSMNSSITCKSNANGMVATVLILIHDYIAKVFVHGSSNTNINANIST